MQGDLYCSAFKSVVRFARVFSSDKADDAGLLAQVKEDNEVRREKDRKDTMVLNAEQY
ncbi:MAG: hypothetical protein LBL82_07235 [Oscillospiraceae bacterium]|nr:hypothetical protein [Oscillospiraceae bacterium]